VKKSLECPLLSLAVDGSNAVYCGGIDGPIRQFDIEQDSVTVIGNHGHEDPQKRGVSCLQSISSSSSLLASAGWDGTFHLWDVRFSSSVASVDLPGKAFDMDVSSDGNMAVVATSGRRNIFIDLRNAQNNQVEILLDRESSLKYQTRCIKFFPSSTGIAVGSIEGRVAIEYLDDVTGVPSNRKKYAFKCHRISDTIYPVNTIAFHKYGTFATGGADGTVITWDGNSKKKIATIAKLPTSVACVAFNESGDQIAMASSYTFEEGERDHPREEIYVRDVIDGEVMPKASSK